MSMSEHTREAHEHAVGIWCDDCPDADKKRIEVLLVEHREIEPRELVMSDCACGWTNPMNGTGYAYRKHVAAVLAAHVAAVVADKGAETERLREAISTIEAAWSVCDDDRQAAWDERDVALARLGAIAALAEEWKAPPLPNHDGEPASDAGFRKGFYAAVEMAQRDLSERLADSAGAIAKHEQEVRAGALREFVEEIRQSRGEFIDITGIRHDGMIDDDVIVSTFNKHIARADGLTEGQECHPFDEACERGLGPCRKHGGSLIEGQAGE